MSDNTICQFNCIFPDEFQKFYKNNSLIRLLLKATDNTLEKALNEALKCGYRHIDTAHIYMNEHIVGKVLYEWISSGRVTRDELFIVTKATINITKSYSIAENSEI